MVRWQALPVCVLVLGSAAAQADVAGLVERLGSTDARTRSDAYSELQRTRPPDLVPLLHKRLPGFPVDGQHYGMYLLQMYPIDETRATYRRFLEQGGPFLRAASAAALYRSGDRGAAAALAGAIAAADEREQSLILGRLHGIDDPEVLAAVRALVRPGRQDFALENALYHLLTAAGGRDAAAVRAAEQVLATSADDRERAVCAAFLVALGETKHAGILAERIAADPGLLHRLQRFLDRAPRLEEAVLDALVGCLERARNQAEVSYPARILGRHAEQRAIGPLRKLLASDNEALRKAALEAMGSIPGALEPKQLRELLASPDAAVALVAADTLRRMDDPSGLDRVLELVGQGGRGKAEAVRVLGGFRIRRAVPPLLDALADADLQVRRHAFHGLQMLWPDLFPYRRFDLDTAGYRPDGPDGQRADGLRVLRAWWEAAK